jgi:glycosyltransferase involved in cell wall biosynthesis
MAEIRLAFCIDNMQIGGTELNAVRWAEQLRSADYDLSVVHFRIDGPLRSRYENIGARMLHLPIRNLYGPNALRLGAHLARFLVRERIDIFHAHDIYSNIFGVQWARVAGVRSVIASRRWWHLSPRPAHRVANRWAYRAAHRVLANSPSVAKLLEKEEGVSDSKVVCVPNFVDENAFRPLPPGEREAWRRRLGVPAEAFVIGMVARLDPIKDHESLLGAFAKILDAFPGAHLLCLGDGPRRAALKRVASDLGIDRAVHFPGTVTPPFNPHLLFDISVLCSLTEGFPNSVVEGMAAAKPVVATRVGGVPDAIRDGHSGLLVPPGDPAALEQALRVLIDNPERARALALAAQAEARAEFHSSVVIARLRSLYESLHQRRKP